MSIDKASTHRENTASEQAERIAIAETLQKSQKGFLLLAQKTALLKQPNKKQTEEINHYRKRLQDPQYQDPHNQKWLKDRIAKLQQESNNNTSLNMTLPSDFSPKIQRLPQQPKNIIPTDNQPNKQFTGIKDVLPNPDLYKDIQGNIPDETIGNRFEHLRDAELINQIAGNMFDAEGNKIFNPYLAKAAGTAAFAVWEFAYNKNANKQEIPITLTWQGKNITGFVGVTADTAYANINFNFG